VIKMLDREGHEMYVYLYALDQTVHVVETRSKIYEARNVTGEKILERHF